MKTIARPSAPVSHPLPQEEGWLYVMEGELSEALALGARMVEGDARLLTPSPLPAGVSGKSFDRWKSDEARYRWCMRYIGSIMGERVGALDLEALLSGMGHSAAYERVYLFVPAYDAERMREEAGVLWDGRRRMYYATPQADMGRLFPWLTPAARQAWEAEQTMARSLTLLVQDRARAEASNGGLPGSGDLRSEVSGAPKVIRPPSRTRA